MENILGCHEIAKTDFVRGQNCHLYDKAGRRYVDLESGIWCTALGHNNPRVNRVMKEQIDRLVHLGTRYPSELAEKAATAILQITGIDDGKCVFLTSGSEAMEFAVQAARQATGNRFLISLRNSYLAAFGSAGKRPDSEWRLFDSGAGEAPGEAPGDAAYQDLAGFAFEPGGSGVGFLRFPSDGRVKEIAGRVRESGGLVIANEVTTGMGRTGRWFGFQHYDVQPDIVALGKGLGNGYPVSAVAMRAEVARKLEGKGFRYVQSHQNDPLGCSVADEVIAIMKEGWVERGRELGAFFLEGLKSLGHKHANVKEARGRGMMLGLELQPNAGPSAASVYQTLLERGFLVGCYPAGNMLRFDPALTIEKEALQEFLECLDDILE